MGFFIDQHQRFRGNLQELVELATQCSRFMNLSGDVDKINERTVRFYVSEGLVDKPTRIGRDAEYNYRHLLQFLMGRYLVDAGYPIAKVAPYVTSKNSPDLEQMLLSPSKPNLAELLVASYSKRDRNDFEERFLPGSVKFTKPHNKKTLEEEKEFSLRNPSQNIFKDNQLLNDGLIEKLKIEIRDMNELTRVKIRQTHREIENLANLQAECMARIKDLHQLMMVIQRSGEDEVRKLEKKLDELMVIVKQKN